MIFRRFLQRLGQHQWGAIAIATELAIVIVGVFIGMQVTNWNEERREVLRGHEYLARCGDHFGTVLDYATIKDAIDYPCTLDIPAPKIRAAVDALKDAPRFVPALRIRFADNQTALNDLQFANGDTLKNFRAMRSATQ